MLHLAQNPYASLATNKSSDKPINVPHFSVHVKDEDLQEAKIKQLEKPVRMSFPYSGRRGRRNRGGRGGGGQLLPPIFCQPKKLRV